jgi:hypothetical protein
VTRAGDPDRKRAAGDRLTPVASALDHHHRATDRTPSICQNVKYARVDYSTNGA